MRTYKEKCEEFASKLSVKHENLVGRTELYLGVFIAPEIFDQIAQFTTENKVKAAIFTRGNNAIVLCLDYTSEMTFNSLESKN